MFPQFVTFLDKLSRAMHMDQIAKDVGVDLHTESLLLRAEQLAKLEYDKNIDKVKRSTFRFQTSSLLRSFDIFFLFRGTSYCSVILLIRRRYPGIVYIAIFPTEKYFDKNCFISIIVYYYYYIFFILICSHFYYRSLGDYIQFF